MRFSCGQGYIFYRIWDIMDGGGIAVLKRVRKIQEKETKREKILKGGKKGDNENEVTKKKR